MLDNVIKKIDNDNDYLAIVRHILENSEFQKIGDCVHHGTTRLYHSMRVSYYSYKIAKKFKLDFESTARAGLMHDFFYNEHGGITKEGIKSTFTHNKVAVKNSEKYFGLNYKEKDIIEKHMFPVTPYAPKYMESYIVSLVDKGIGLLEFNRKFKCDLKICALSVLMYFIII